MSHPIPDSALSQHVIVLGKTRSGKSSTLRLLIEGLLDRSKPVCIVDPKGDWWGLKSSADGRSAGYPVVIFGGAHADVPINQHSGKVVADLVATDNRPAIIDLGGWMVGERTRFFIDFASTMFVVARGHRWLCIDEVHNFCLDEATEILTARGWLKWHQIRIDEMAVCFDLEKETYNYGAIQRVIVRRHDGNMVRLKSDGIDCLATPDHRVVLRREQRAAGRRKKLYPWTFCKADKTPNQIRIPKGSAPVGIGIVGLTEELCRIIGWVITDGCYHDKRTKIPVFCLSQAKSTTKKGVNISSIMSDILGQHKGVSRYARPKRRSGKGGGPSFSWYLGKELSASILDVLGKEIHRLPRDLITNASKSQIEALMHGLLEGDGSTQGMSGWRAFYAGLNEGLADDFQELAIRAGWSASKRFVKQNGQWVVLLSTRSHHYVRKLSNEHYSGIVWDVTVPTGAFVARRDGKTFVTGNCPQGKVLDPDSGKALHWANRLASEGAGKGIVLLSASQRPQKVHKDYLTSHETLIAKRVIHPLDRGAIKDWIDGCGDPAKGREVLDTLAALERSEGWVWSPEIGFGPKRVKFPMFKTYDSFAVQTGDAGKKLKGWASVDLDAVKARLAKVVEDAKANDPKELRAEIARLRKEAASKPTTVVPTPPSDDVVATACADARAQCEAELAPVWFRRGVEAAINESKKRLDQIDVPKFIDGEMKAWRSIGAVPASRPQRSVPSLSPAAPRVAAPPAPRHAPISRNGAALDRPLQLIVDSIRWWNVLGVPAPSHPQAAFISGYSHKSGTWATYLSRLRSSGLIEGRGDLTLTADGLASARDPDVQPTGEHLRAAVLEKLDLPLVKILGPIINAYPDGLSHQQASERAGYSAQSGTWATYLSRLRSLDLIEGRGDLKAQDWLFPSE